MIKSFSSRSDRNSAPLRPGLGYAIGHHGELLQGVFEGSDGRLHRGLVTLPLPAMRTTATYRPKSGVPIETFPTDKAKAKRAAILALRHLGYPQSGGDLAIESSIPVGFGYGSSTADVVATIRAVASAAGVFLRKSTIAMLAVRAETASDSTVFDEEAVLFAQREGVLLEALGGSFPPLYVLGLSSGGDEAVDTLAHPPARYSDPEIHTFQVLRGLARHAIEHQDADLLGRIATASARISQRYLPKARLENAIALTHRHQACGVQVAHSGSLIGILVDPRKPGARKTLAKLAQDAIQDGFMLTVAHALFADAEPIGGRIAHLH